MSISSRIRTTSAKLYGALRVILAARKTWTWPTPSDVVIYDAAGQDLFCEYLRPWSAQVLHCRGEALNVPVLLASLFRPGPRYRAYVSEFIDRVRPRLVVTLIDNNRDFYSLSARHPYLKTLFVQNGYRGYYQDVFESLVTQPAPRGSLRVDYMMTFGSLTGAEYAKYVAGSIVPIGSLTNNWVPKQAVRTPGVLAYISQYNTSGVWVGGQYFTREEFWVNPDRLTITTLEKYASERGKQLVVVTRARTLKELESEQAYFNDLAGRPLSFASDRRADGTYHAVDSAEVVVSNTSTLGLESAVRGQKTAFFPIHRSIYAAKQAGLIWDRGLSWPVVHDDEGPFWTCRSDPEAFVRILDHLFAISDEQWQEELSAHRFHDLMTYNPGNTRLRSVFEQALGTMIGVGE